MDDPDIDGSEINHFSALVSSALDLDTDRFVVSSDSESCVLSFSSTTPSNPPPAIVYPEPGNPRHSSGSTITHLSLHSIPDFHRGHSKTGSSSSQFLQQVKRRLAHGVGSMRRSKSKNPSAESLRSVLGSHSSKEILTGEGEFCNIATQEVCPDNYSVESFFAHCEGHWSSTSSFSSSTTGCSQSTEPQSPELPSPSSSDFSFDERELAEVRKDEMSPVGSSFESSGSRLGSLFKADGIGRSFSLSSRSSKKRPTLHPAHIPLPDSVPSSPHKLKPKPKAFSCPPSSFSSSSSSLSLSSRPSGPVCEPEFDLDVFGKGPPTMVRRSSETMTFPSRTRGRLRSRSADAGHSASVAVTKLFETDSKIFNGSNKKKHASLPASPSIPICPDPSLSAVPSWEHVQLSTLSPNERRTRPRQLPPIPPSPRGPPPSPPSPASYFPSQVSPNVASRSGSGDGERAQVPPNPPHRGVGGHGMIRDTSSRPTSRNTAGRTLLAPVPLVPSSPRPRHSLSMKSTRARNTSAHTLSVISSDDDGETSARRPSSPFPLSLGPRGNRHSRTSVSSHYDSSADSSVESCQGSDED